MNKMLPEAASALNKRMREEARDKYGLDESETEMLMANGISLAYQLDNHRRAKFVGQYLTEMAELFEDVEDELREAFGD